MGQTDSDGAADGEEGELSVDAILDVLAHHHRRHMLRILREEADDEVSEDDLIGRLQRQEQRRTGEKPSWDHLSATLHHVHQPKLSEAGVVEHEPSNETYLYQQHDRIERWLDHIESAHETE